MYKRNIEQRNRERKQTLGQEKRERETETEGGRHVDSKNRGGKEKERDGKGRRGEGREKGGRGGERKIDNETHHTQTANVKISLNIKKKQGKCNPKKLLSLYILAPKLSI